MAQPNVITERISSKVLSDAVSGMMLTTLTRSVEFFANSTIKIAPILCFGVFIGMLIITNYFMIVFLLFACLILNDKWIQGGNPNSFVNTIISLNMNSLKSVDNSNINSNNMLGNVNEEIKEKTHGVERVLSFYYKYLHLVRWTVVFLYCSYDRLPYLCNEY